MIISKNILEAIDFATKAHDGQIRKSNGLPKIVHPYGVAMILSNYGYGEDHIIAGLLHDVVEDCDIQIGSIHANFGYKIAIYVLDLTEPIKSMEWKKRKTAHIEHIRHAILLSKIVCAADKIHNLLTLEEELKTQGENVWKKFNAPKKDILWYYSSMCDSIIHCYEESDIPILNDLKEIVDRFVAENED